MTAMFTDSGGYTSTVGGKSPMRQPTNTPKSTPMSDLQFMLHNERKQHEDQYRYANGHNDHGEGR